MTHKNTEATFLKYQRRSLQNPTDTTKVIKEL